MAENTALGGQAPQLNRIRVLDTAFARASPLTDEQFSFIIHHVDQGAAHADILTLLNDTFSLKENIVTVEETILYITCNKERKQALLKRAAKYSWGPAKPAPAPKIYFGNGEGLDRERKFTDEMRAFILWKFELGHRKLAILESFNTQFNTQFSITSLKICLTNITKNSKAAEQLAQYATTFGWWEPPPAPGSPAGVRAARQLRLRQARKRHAEKTQIQKNWMNGIGRFESEQLPSPDAAAGKGQTRASDTADDGTLVRPIKIEDSDDEGGGITSKAVLTHFNAIADEMDPSPWDQLSPTPLQRAPAQNSRQEIYDGEMELSNVSDEDAGADLSEYSSEDVPESSSSNRPSAKGCQIPARN